MLTLEESTRQNLRRTLMAGGILGGLILLRDLRGLSLSELRIALSHGLASFRTWLGASGQADGLLSPEGYTLSNTAILTSPRYAAIANDLGASFRFSLIVFALIISLPILFWIGKTLLETSTELIVSMRRIAIASAGARTDAGELAEILREEVHPLAGDIRTIARDVDRLRAVVREAVLTPAPPKPKRRVLDDEEERARQGDTKVLTLKPTGEHEAERD